jgi:hypothetical protein
MFSKNPFDSGEPSVVHHSEERNAVNISLLFPSILTSGRRDKLEVGEGIVCASSTGKVPMCPGDLEEKV